MKWSVLILLLTSLAISSACAHLRGGDAQARQSAQLWTEAHLAFHAENFRHAQAAFQQLADEYQDSEEGREALFYLGTLRLDPRNPDWDPAPAVDALRRYLALDTARAVIHRRPEATTMLRLADQLAAAPAEHDTAAGVGQAPPRDAAGTPDRVATRAQVQALLAEADSLRRLLDERDETIRRQREELDRIRRVLAPRTP